MRSKPDDRSDNVDRLQEHIDNTNQNIRLTNEMIEKTDNKKGKDDLKAKNCRRKEALNGFKSEIKDEALDKEKGYK